jgi:hypothetical protein
MPHKATIEFTESLRDGEGDASRGVGVGRRLSALLRPRVLRESGVDADAI